MRQNCWIVFLANIVFFGQYGVPLTLPKGIHTYWIQKMDDTPEMAENLGREPQINTDRHRFFSLICVHSCLSVVSCLLLCRYLWALPVLGSARQLCTGRASRAPRIMSHLDMVIRFTQVCPFTGISASAVIGPAFTPGYAEAKPQFHTGVSRVYAAPVDGRQEPGEPG